MKCSSTNIANSAFHGTRLNVNHVSQVMETLLKTAEGRFGISRSQIAAETMFVSHETYTPARGGSAAAEIHALRGAFGEQANQVIIANTKGFTGHTMGVGVEDVVAVKALEYGIVPPIANIQDGFEPDPELGDLNLSHGGKYPVQFSLRLGAGFGSQIAMTLLRKIPGQGERVDKAIYNRWLSDVSGYPTTELEISQRTLHIKNQGVPAQKPAASRWQFGQGPTLWAARLPTASNALPSLPLPVAQPVAAQPTAVNSAAGCNPARRYRRDQGFCALRCQREDRLPAGSTCPGSRSGSRPWHRYRQAGRAVRLHPHAVWHRPPRRFAAFGLQHACQGDRLCQGFARFPSMPVASPVPQPVVAAGRPGTRQLAPAVVPLPLLRQHGGDQGLCSCRGQREDRLPEEVLDLDLDLEADLGIDTVKQAELFAAIRTQYGIARREDLRLSDYNTLAKVFRFVEDSLASTTCTAG